MAGIPRIKQNAWDNWAGYYGMRKVIDFTNSTTASAEQNAETWAAEKTLLRDPAILLGKAMARLKSTHWCNAYDKEALRLLKQARDRVNKAAFDKRVHEALTRI